jgi:hypothetical protein
VTNDCRCSATFDDVRDVMVVMGCGIYVGPAGPHGYHTWIGRVSILNDQSNRGDDTHMAKIDASVDNVDIDALPLVRVVVRVREVPGCASGEWPCGTQPTQAPTCIRSRRVKIRKPFRTDE